MPMSSLPKPCTDLNCRGQHEQAERVALAEYICKSRGARFTKQRREVLELLWQSGRPTGAYELIEGLKQKTSRPVLPPTIYRALEFLIAQGLAVKVQSLNAYAPSLHPERQNDCFLFICGNCGIADEWEDPRIGRLIAASASSHEFNVTKRIIEVEGICGLCVNAEET